MQDCVSVLRQGDPWGHLGWHHGALPQVRTWEELSSWKAVRETGWGVGTCRAGFVDGREPGAVGTAGSQLR